MRRPGHALPFFVLVLIFHKQGVLGATHVGVGKECVGHDLLKQFEDKSRVKEYTQP